MKTFTFNADNFRTLHADVLEGKAVKLTKPNGARILITGDFTHTMEFLYYIEIVTPEGQRSPVDVTIEAADLRALFDGETFTQYESEN